MARQYKLFGTLEIIEDGAPNQVMQSPRGCALISYLLVTREAQTREHLADLLWESTSTRQALRRLRQLLHRIRPFLPELQVTRRTVTFQPNPHHRRAQLVVLTDKGREAYEAAMALQAPWINQLSKDIPGLIRDREQ